MKTSSLLVLAASAVLFLRPTISPAQVQINMDATPVEMVENFFGPGILFYDNVTFQGVNVSRGFFSNADSTLLGMESGVFLTSGTGFFIPGPNLSGSTGSANGAPGHPVLNSIALATTYDAAVLEFDFLPVNDTIKFNYSFGSEEYNEHVGLSYYDVCGAFITGPNPAGGFYTNKNIMKVPGTTNTNVSINSINNGYAPAGVIPTGPCTNCWFFQDNTGGMELEYDGFTTKLICWILVLPYNDYHILLGIADVFGPGYDSGLFLEDHSLFSPGPAQFTSFNFFTELNPELPWDVTGVLGNQSVTLEVPANVDVSNLVASYTETGAYVSVEGVNQTSGVTPNDFTDTVVYQLHGYEIKDWQVIVELVTETDAPDFEKVVIKPNPLKGTIEIGNAGGMNIRIFDMRGITLITYQCHDSRISLPAGDLKPGIYFAGLEKNGRRQTRKIVIN